MLLAILQSKHGADSFYYIYHIRKIIRVTENVIYHLVRCLKLDLFHVNKMAARFYSVIQDLYYYLQQ